MIKCVIFDVYGVTVEEGVDELFRNMNRLLGEEAFVRRKGLYNAALAGKLTERQHYKELSRITGFTPARIRKCMETGYPKAMKIDKSVLKVAQSLRANGYKTVILSNITKRDKSINKKRKLFEKFSPVILSCDAGSVKPQKRIYDIFLSRARIDPARCVLVDDRPENFAYPKKIGMKTIHFRNAAQLKRDLRKLGVKI